MATAQTTLPVAAVPIGHFVYSYRVARWVEVLDSMTELGITNLTVEGDPEPLAFPAGEDLPTCLPLYDLRPSFSEVSEDARS